MLSEADLVHIKGLSVDGVTRALSGSAGSPCAESERRAGEARLAFFERGTERPAGVLQVSPEMSETGKDRLREALSIHGKPHGIMLIDSESAFHELTSRLDDAQFTEQRRLAAQEIAGCSAFRRTCSARRPPTR